jgi:hypothetical protein
LKSAAGSFTGDHQYRLSRIPEMTMNRMKKAAAAVSNTTMDLLEKASSPATRAGLAIERSAKCSTKAGRGKVAQKMTEGSANNHQYTPEHIEGFRMLYKDCLTRGPLSKANADGMMRKIEDELGFCPVSWAADGQ